MKIAVCGGGNAAHTLAGLLSAWPEHIVKIYLSFPDEAWHWQQGAAKNGGMVVNFPDRTITGKPHTISSDPAEVIPDSDVVLLALPAFAHEQVLEEISPYLEPGAWVGALPARGGFEWESAVRLGQDHPSLTVFGLQTLPWACRIEEFGHAVQVKGSKAVVEVASLPEDNAAQVAGILEGLLGVHLKSVPCFLCLSLANTGQLLHPGLMYGHFRDWQGEVYPEAPLFYQGANETAAETLQQMSAEVQVIRQNLAAAFPCMDFSPVRPLIDWIRVSYEGDIEDPSTLQSCLATNRSYAGLIAPVKENGSGFIPDFRSRYLTEDVPYGLVVTKGIAELAGVNTPVIDRVILWAQERLGCEYLVGDRLSGRDIFSARAPQRYGITSLEQLETLTAGVFPQNPNRS
jgi:hypothetical protein